MVLKYNTINTAHILYNAHKRVSDSCDMLRDLTEPRNREDEYNASTIDHDQIDDELRDIVVCLGLAKEGISKLISVLESEMK